MAFDLKAIMEANKTEDGYNVEAIMKNIDNDYVNPIVAKNKPDVEKINSEYLGTVIKGLGIEGNSVDDLKLWAKQMGGNTDEIKEQNLKLSNNYKELEEKYKEIAGKYSTIEQEYNNTKQISAVLAKGYNQEEAEFIQFKLSKQATEEKTFDSLLEEYAKDKQKTKTDNVFLKNKFRGGESDFLAAYKARKKY